jgi:RimJ/RimL family protein N-acetyltransferase
MTESRSGTAIVLHPVDRVMKAAMQRSRDAFAALIETSLPEAWPQFPEAFSIEGPSHQSPWIGYLFMRTSDGALLGNGGFVAPPDQGGVVEIGYEIAPAHQNQGYATLAARLLVNLAFTHEANTVIAHTLGYWNASNAVLQKLGMRFVDEASDAEHGPIWRWQIDRPKARPLATRATMRESIGCWLRDRQLRQPAVAPEHVAATLAPSRRLSKWRDPNRLR